MNPDSDHPQLPNIKIHHPPSPRHSSSSSTLSFPSTPSPTAGARRKIGVVFDLSEESSSVVRWAVDHYLLPGDDVVLLHVSPTSVLYGADWGSLPLETQPSFEDPDSQSQESQSSQEDFDDFTSSKVEDLAKPLEELGFPYKIHIVKDHEVLERLSLEIERLGLSHVILGSRKFDDYDHLCDSSVVFVRYPGFRDDDDDTVKSGGDNSRFIVRLSDLEIDVGDDDEFADEDEDDDEDADEDADEDDDEDDEDDDEDNDEDDDEDDDEDVAAASAHDEHIKDE